VSDTDNAGNIRRGLSEKGDIRGADLTLGTANEHTEKVRLVRQVDRADRIENKRRQGTKRGRKCGRESGACGRDKLALAVDADKRRPSQELERRRRRKRKSSMR
jgi:hypothetical protein